MRIMTSNQRRIVLASVVFFVAVCWLTAPFWGRIETQDVLLPHAPLVFDADEAYRITGEFVTRNPRRVLGSLEARQAAGYIRDQLRRLGYQVSPPIYFDAMIAGRRQAGNNILGYKAGALPDILAVMAHYDTARTTVQGAMDDGGGIGVMLELARVFADNSLRHSLLIVASDGEEWGMLGAADLASNYPGRNRIAAALSLDWVSIGDLAGFRLHVDGLGSGYAPAWLRRVAAKAAGQSGVPVDSPSGFREHVERAVALSRTDQGPLLGAGIPAIDLDSISSDEPRVREVYHTQHDTIENLKTASVAVYGQAAERILRSIDELPSTPGMQDAFRWRADTYIAPWGMKVLHVLAFLPFLAIVVCAWVRHRRALTAPAALKEIIFLLSWLIPLLLFYALVLFCRLMRLFPRNSLFPGPFRDPILANPAWGVVAIIAAVVLGTGIGLHFLARYLTRGEPGAFHASRLVLLTMLVLAVVLEFSRNPYGATTFLLIPVYVWATVGPRRSLGPRLAGVLGIVAAGVAAPVIFSIQERGFGMGSGILWYAILALGNGMLTWKGFMIAALAAVIGLRFASLLFTKETMEPR